MQFLDQPSQAFPGLFLPAGIHLLYLEGGLDRVDRTLNTHVIRINNQVVVAWVFDAGVKILFGKGHALRIISNNSDMRLFLTDLELVR